MPATLTFVQVGPNKSVQVRIFPNRQRLIERNIDVAVNQKSIVNIQRISNVKMLGKDLNKFLNNIRAQLIEILFETPIGELVAQGYMSNGRLSLNINKSEWKCLGKMTTDFLVKIRLEAGVFRTEDTFYIERSKYSRCDQRLITISRPFKGEEEKSFSYKLHRHSTISTASDCLDLYVYSMPI